MGLKSCSSHPSFPTEQQEEVGCSVAHTKQRCWCLYSSPVLGVICATSYRVTAWGLPTSSEFMCSLVLWHMVGIKHIPVLRTWKQPWKLHVVQWWWKRLLEVTFITRLLQLNVGFTIWVSCVFSVSWIKQFLSCRKPLGHAGMWSAGAHLWLFSHEIRLLLKKCFHSSADTQI